MFRCANTIIYIQGIPGSYGYRSLEIIYIYIATVPRLVKAPKMIGSPMAGNNRSEE